MTTREMASDFIFDKCCSCRCAAHKKPDGSVKHCGRLRGFQLFVQGKWDTTPKLTAMIYHDCRFYKRNAISIDYKDIFMSAYFVLRKMEEWMELGEERKE